MPKTSSLKQTKRLLSIVHELRQKCPWDKKQTHKSLVPHLIEEAFETVDAIESKKSQNLQEELGDLLLQICLHAELSEEKGNFQFEDVAKTIADKMVRRHPHVFGDVTYTTAKAHTKLWQEIKSKEKPKKTSLLETVPKGMPALQLAQRYGHIAASVNFDWDNIDDVVKKVDEEWNELKREIYRRKKNKRQIENELGDVFFSLTNLARHLKLNAETSARIGAKKFFLRFTAIEKMKKKEGISIRHCSQPELERAWQQVKKGKPTKSQ